MFPYVGSVVHVPGQKFGREQGGTYLLKCEFPGLNPVYPPSVLAWFTIPQEAIAGLLPVVSKVCLSAALNSATAM